VLRGRTENDLANVKKDETKKGESEKITSFVFFRSVKGSNRCIAATAAT